MPAARTEFRPWRRCRSPQPAMPMRVERSFVWLTSLSSSIFLCYLTWEHLMFGLRPSRRQFNLDVLNSATSCGLWIVDRDTAVDLGTFGDFGNSGNPVLRPSACSFSQLPLPYPLC